MNLTRHPFDRRGLQPLEVEHEGSAVVVRVLGDLDAWSSPALHDCLAGLLDSGAQQLLVDLGAVPFCDSTGLGVLVGAHRRLAASDGRLTVRGPRPPVRHLLEISGLDRVFEVR